MNLPLAVMEILLGPVEKRNDVYRQLLEANGFDVSVDWFQSIYEAELSEGKRKGQHFTPASIYSLIPRLTGLPDGYVHEPTAGTGGLIIGDWWEKCKMKWPWEVFPSDNYYVAWELSDRAIPLLLLNMSIRGMMGEVYHGDVLEQTIVHRFLLVNRNNDGLGFSDVAEVNQYAKIVEL